MIDLGPLLIAWLRAVPMSLGLPLPGLATRVALGLVLGLVGLGTAVGAGVAPLDELVIGVGLGLSLAWPLWAARWAGAVVGVPLGRRVPGPSLVYSSLAWVVFLTLGGGRLLVSGYAGSYVRWPIGGAPRIGLEALLGTGAELVSLAARLALPSLLAIAIGELCAGLLARFEGAAGLPADASALARGLRPILVMLLLVGSLAAFAQGVGVAMASHR